MTELRVGDIVTVTKLGVEILNFHSRTQFMLRDLLFVIDLRASSMFQEFVTPFVVWNFRLQRAVLMPSFTRKTYEAALVINNVV